jgi:hypothetical protein
LKVGSSPRFNEYSMKMFVMKPNCKLLIYDEIGLHVIKSK